MRKVLAVTKTKKEYMKMLGSIESSKIVCQAVREDIAKTVGDATRIENNGNPMCAYLDFCSMLKGSEKIAIEKCFQHYCFDGAYLAITLCLTKRHPKYLSCPNLIVSEIHSMAEKYGRVLSEIKSMESDRSMDTEYGVVYGKPQCRMFFVMFKVV
jgi:hypothetical protein